VKAIIVFVLIGLVVFGLTSCDSTTNNARIIARKKMERLMGEVYLLEMHYQKFYGTPAMYTPHLDSALTTIFKKYGVSKLQYEKSFTYYASTPLLFMKMNEQIIQNYNRDLIQK
jgi:hypothetical protein